MGTRPAIDLAGSVEHLTMRPSGITRTGADLLAPQELSVRDPREGDAESEGVATLSPRRPVQGWLTIGDTPLCEPPEPAGTHLQARSEFSLST